MLVHTRQQSDQQTSRRRGFTLVEMLVVIVILVILVALTVGAINQTSKDDKIYAASREVQAMLEGAKDRALHAREPRGVRFLRHPNDPDVITGMVYIGAPGKYAEGQIRIAGTNNRTITGSGINGWSNLRTRGLLINYARIRINNQLPYYTVVFVPLNGGIPAHWELTRDFAGTVNTLRDYELELAPAILPNAEPRTLADNVIIDRDHCQPPSWRSLAQLDILFSPRGTVIGNAAAAGHIHILITDFTDASGAGHAGLGSSKEFAETIVTVTTQTGSVSTHSVFSTADPFRNAESGVETR